MTGTWTKQVLGDLIEPRKEMVNPKKLGETQIDHFSMPAFDADGRPERVPASAIKSPKQRIASGDVLISLLNPWIKRVWAPALDNAAPGLASSLFLVATPGEHTARGFVYYLAQSRQVQSALVSRANGTSSSHQVVSIQNALDIDVKVPDLPTQHAIVDVLEKVDRKIAIARQCRSKLDLVVVGATAQALTLGSRKASFLDAVEVTSGYSYRSQELRDTADTALINLKNFRRTGGFRMDGFKGLSPDACYRDDQVVEPGDLLVAMTDLTQEAEVVGRVVRVPDVGSYKSFVASLDTAVLRSTGVASREVLYGLLLTSNFRQHCRAYANGTTVLHMSRRAFADATLPLPSADATARLEPLLQAALRLYDDLWREELGLAKLRDEFLEGLLSGGLVVSP